MIDYRIHTNGDTSKGSMHTAVKYIDGQATSQFLVVKVIEEETNAPKPKGAEC